MHKQRAQIVVEFAIIAPVLILIVVGVLNFGRAYYTYIDVANEARSQARIASYIPDLACVDTPFPAPPAPPPPVRLECNPQEAGVSIPNARRVTITRTFDTLAFFLGNNGTILLTASATMPALA